MNRNKFLIVSLICCVFFLFSCKTNRADSGLNIINGIDDTDNKYPAVLRIITETIFSEESGSSSSHSGCSASVISHNTLLTASHCFYDALGDLAKYKSLKDVKIEIKTSLPSGKTVKTERFYSNDSFEKYNSMVDYTKELDTKAYEYLGLASHNDVGIVVFEDNTFSEITPLKISNQNVKEGTSVVIVGYAPRTDYKKITDNDDPDFGKFYLDDFDDSDLQGLSIIRRYGSAVVQKNDRCVEENLSFKTHLKNASYDPKNRVDPVGVNSAVYCGDSGGPTLLSDNQNLIVGVTSYSLEDDSYTESCEVTFNPDVVNWLNKINDTTDAVIPMDEIK